MKKMKNSLPPKSLVALKRFLKGQRNVRLAYLFGSSAKGKAGPLSDIDVAVYFDTRIHRRDFKRESFLISRISEILKTSRIDLVVLNEAPLLLSFHVIKDGRLLKGNINEKVFFESRIIDDYLDREYFDEIYYRELEKRIGSRGLL